MPHLPRPPQAAPTPADAPRRIGVLSDTHGLVRPEALAALQGAELLVHAGDIGGPEVLHSLSSIAPVVAVRGNNDRGEWARGLPETRLLELGSLKLYLLHSVHDLDLDPAAAGISVVVSGHSHRPSIEVRDGVLYLNPGSAGPRRFHLPIGVAWLELRGGRPEARLVPLEAPRPEPRQERVP